MIVHSRPWIMEADVAALRQTALSGWLVGGPLQERLRSAVAAVCGAPDAALFPSGRSALRAALGSLALPPGAGVIVQAYACDAVQWAIEAAGLRPILCDIGPAWTCTPETVTQVMGEDPAALILAPPFGLFQSAAAFRSFGLPIIHDLCQASPSVLAGRWDQAGDLAVLSFHPTKYVGGAGGGAVIGVVSDSLAKSALDWDAFAPFGELQAALALSQLDRLDQARSRRDQLIKRYRADLPPAWTAGFAEAQDVKDGDLFRCILNFPGIDFSALRAAAELDGVAIRRGVDSLLRAPDRTLFPHAAQSLARTVSLPFYPALTDKEGEAVVRWALAHGPAHAC